MGSHRHDLWYDTQILYSLNWSGGAGGGYGSRGAQLRRFRSEVSDPEKTVAEGDQVGHLRVFKAFKEQIWWDFGIFCLCVGL